MESNLSKIAQLSLFFGPRGPKKERDERKRILKKQTNERIETKRNQ